MQLLGRGPITPKEKKEYFEKSLKDAVELGVPPKNSQMFLADILDALFKICREYPNAKPSSIQEARKLFDEYYDWLTSD